MYIVYFWDGSTAIVDYDTLTMMLLTYPPNYIISWEPYTAPPPTVYTCPYCGATFSTQEALNTHIASAHPTPVVTYGTAIVAITAPSSAFQGDTVIVDVSVRNIGSIDQNIAVTGVYDSISLSWQFNYLDFSPYETLIFRGWFTMPSKKVRVTVYSKYWDGSKWVQDDSGYVDIALGAVPSPEFSGFTIADYSKL